MTNPTMAMINPDISRSSMIDYRFGMQ